MFTPVWTLYLPLFKVLCIQFPVLIRNSKTRSHVLYEYFFLLNTAHPAFIIPALSIILTNLCIIIYYYKALAIYGRYSENREEKLSKFYRRRFNHEPSVLHEHIIYIIRSWRLIAMFTEYARIIL